MTETIESRLKDRARVLGFRLSGIALSADADGFARFDAWLDAGFAGDMAYLGRHREARRHPRAVLPDVRSVVMLGMEYGAGNGERGAGTGPAGRVAAYAQGLDYHELIRDRLNELAAWLATQVPDSVSRGVVDTAPLLERDFARRAGLGWVGKNTMLIDKHRGSFFFLAALLTSAELTPDRPHEASHCGTCTACLDACPTAAFPGPGVLDARKCISYLTIELHTAIPDDLAERVGDWIWGCDVCQTVCPWNRHTETRDGITVPTDPILASLDPLELLGLSDAEFRRRFRGTVFFRGKRTNLLRNAAVVLGNVGDGRALPALRAAATDPDEVIAAAARWAIGRIEGRESSAGNSPR